MLLKIRGICPRMRRSFIRSISHVKGETSVPLLGQTINQMLQETVAKHTQASAVIIPHQNIHWDYAQFHHTITQMAVGLQKKTTLRKGDRIGIWLNNCAEWLVCQYATAKLGLILVSINPAYQTEELAHCLNLVECHTLVLRAEQLAMIKQLSPHLLDNRAQQQHSKVPSLQQLVVVSKKEDKEDQHDFTMSSSCVGYEELCSQEVRGEISDVHLDENEPINIQFTSGTTGPPKGATLTHKNIVNNGFFAGEKLKLTTKDRVCVPVPMYHCFGMVIGSLACVTHGSAIVFPCEVFNPAKTLQVCSEQKCTALYGVPTMFIRELALPNFHQYNLKHLRTGIMAGSVCPIDTMNQVMLKMNMKEIMIAYGMTETSPISFQSDADDDPIIKAETVGKVHPHVECKVINSDDGLTVPYGTVGELCTRGYNVMQKYWNDEETTKATIDEEGWLRTGDLVTIDKDGHCRIMGRNKDLIIRGGENIYPREIEDALLSLKFVENASVIGVDDKYYGECVCACIILGSGAILEDEDEDNLTQNIKEHLSKRLAKYKIPKYILFVEDFPMTITGKIQNWRDVLEFLLQGITRH